MYFNLEIPTCYLLDFIVEKDFGCYKELLLWNLHSQKSSEKLISQAGNP